MEITLQENKTWPESESEKNHAKKIGLTQDDIKLGEFLHKNKLLNFRRLQEKGIEITAKQFVGTINFSEFKLKIIPKIYNKDTKNVWKNLFTCLDFIEGNSLAKIVEFEKNEYVESEDSTLQEFIIWRLVYQCKELIKKGLLKSYITNVENLSVLRGKVILKNQFLNDAEKNLKFFCEYDELEHDNIENRIIFQTLLQSKKLYLGPNLRKNVFRLIEQFSGMVQNVPISIPDIDRVAKSYTRQNMHYEDIHRQCRLILKNSMISDYDKGNIPYSVPFFMDMNRVFEEFVTKLVETAYGDQAESQVRQKSWKVNNKEDHDTSNRFMIPDIILQTNESRKIIDVKYKPKLEPSDLYQIGFYIHEFRMKKQKNSDVNDLVSDGSAFAILPDYADSEKKDKSFTSFKKEIKVFQRLINIDKFMELIRIKDEKIKKDRILNKLEEILDPEFEKTSS